MITIEKLKIFSKYNGDDDMWARINKKEERIFSDGDWDLIDSLLQDILIIKNGHTSKTYIQDVDNNLVANLDNIETIDFLKSLVN